MIVQVNGVALAGAQQILPTLEVLPVGSIDQFLKPLKYALDLLLYLNSMHLTAGTADKHALTAYLTKSIAEMPFIEAAISIAARSIITDLATDVFVDMGLISGTLGKWAKIALQSIILVETYATGLVLSIFKLIVGAFIKKSAGSLMGLGKAVVN